MNKIDLHVHSTESDGTFTPSELVSYALEKGLSAIALTDHDTVKGIEAAEKAAKGTSLFLVPGVELSVEYQQGDIHILGLFIDYKSKLLLEYLERFKRTRDTRNKKMAAALSNCGMEISIEEMQAEYADAVLTRAHFARMLMKKGYVGSYREAFDRFLGDGKPCYVEREKITPKEAIELIHQAKGLAILAHPLLYHMGEQELKKLIVQCKSNGLDGLEAIYSMNNGAEERQMKELAAEFGLAISGGSDFHGATKPHIDLGVGRGNLLIPEEVLLNLKKLLYNGI